MESFNVGGVPILHDPPATAVALSARNTEEAAKAPRSRGLHSFTLELNLSRFGHTSPCPPVQ